MKITIRNDDAARVLGIDVVDGAQTIRYALGPGEALEGWLEGGRRFELQEGDDVRAVPTSPWAKPSWATRDDPVDELARIMVARWPEIAGEPYSAAALRRRMPDLAIANGDPIDWALVARVREAIARLGS